MLRRPRTLPPFLSGVIFRLKSTRSIRAKPGHGRSFRNSGDDEERNRRYEDRQKEDLYLHKSKGQHLLTNQRVLDSIVGRSCIKATDTVLEIGPGTGNLTLKLLEVAERVVAVELDRRMVEILQNRVKERGFEGRIDIISKDALKTDFPRFDLVVANIPYNISSPLIAKLVYGSPFRSATLLLQKEFARRLLANPGDSEYNRLAVNVKLVAEVEFVMDVSKRDFHPCPKVDSSVVIIRPRAAVPDVNLDEWRAFTRTCFSKKNKTLGATFKQKKKLMELFKIANASGSEIERIVVSSDDDYDGEEEEEEEEEGSVVSSSSSNLCMSLFKEKIVGVLRSNGYEEKRPSKLCNEELLHLLSLFNQVGVFFHLHGQENDVLSDFNTC